MLRALKNERAALTTSMPRPEPINNPFLSFVLNIVLGDNAAANFVKPVRIGGGGGGRGTA